MEYHSQNKYRGRQLGTCAVLDHPLAIILLHCYPHLCKQVISWAKKNNETAKHDGSRQCRNRQHPCADPASSSNRNSR